MAVEEQCTGLDNDTCLTGFQDQFGPELFFFALLEHSTSPPRSLWQ